MTDRVSDTLSNYEGFNTYTFLKERGLPTDIGAPDGKKLKVDIRLSCWQEC